MQFARLIRFFPSWTPSAVKALTPRERKYWTEMGAYLAKHSQIGITVNDAAAPG